MTYATTNPPSLMQQSIGNSAPAIWTYSSTDATATVDGSGYITNGGALGMKVGDLVIVNDTTNKIMTSHYVITVSSTYPGVVDLSNGTTIGTATNSD
jgi:hypothetical protein